MAHWNLIFGILGETRVHTGRLTGPYFTADIHLPRRPRAAAFCAVDAEPVTKAKHQSVRVDVAESNITRFVSGSQREMRLVD